MIVMDMKIILVHIKKLFSNGIPYDFKIRKWKLFRTDEKLTR